MKRVPWINLVLGVWLFLAPFVLGTFAIGRLPLTNDLALGVLLVTSSWWILAAPAVAPIETWFQVGCGAWLIVAPFALGYRDLPRALANDVAIGIVVLLGSLFELRGLLRALVGAR